MHRFYPYKLIEFIILCLALPTLIWTLSLGHMMFGFLWAATIYCWVIWYFPSYHSDRAKGEWRNLYRSLDHARDDIMLEWHWDAVNWENLKPIIIRWIFATILICLFTAWHSPDRLFYIPLNMPQIIPFLILAYPVLSALPQEFIFCSFFMKRYGHWLQSNTIKIIVSALVFAYAHMLFLNWVAPVLSFFGGVIFAYTYLRTRSLALVTIEHSLYGNSLFIAGIGYYFYSGGIGQ